MTSKQLIKALRISNIKITDITIDSKLSNNRVPVYYEKSKSLICQTPWMEVRGELRKTSHPNIYQLDTLFKGDRKEKVDAWYQFIENLENHISQQVEVHGLKWFTEKNVTIKTLIREEETGLHFIKWPLNLVHNIFIDVNKNSYDYKSIKEKDLVKFIVEVSNLWIHGNQFGLAVVVQKIMVKPVSTEIETEYIFDDSDHSFSDEESNLISLLATEQKVFNRASENLVTFNEGRQYEGERQINPPNSHRRPDNTGDSLNRRSISNYDPFTGLSYNHDTRLVNKQISTSDSPSSEDSDNHLYRKNIDGYKPTQRMDAVYTNTTHIDIAHTDTAHKGINDKPVRITPSGASKNSERQNFETKTLPMTIPKTKMSDTKAFSKNSEKQIFHKPKTVEQNKSKGQSYEAVPKKHLFVINELEDDDIEFDD